MKVVLDTNVLVSGLLFGGVPGRILTAWSTGAIRLVISPPILEEYRRVGLALSKGREPLVGTLEALLAMLTVHALLVDAPPLDERVSEDPDDEMFLAAALAAVRAAAPWPAAVIVEAETAAEATAAVQAGADGVLLDEFPPQELQELVPRLRELAQDRRLVLEASGVQPDQLQAYAVTGIDLISTSAPITRSPWLDLSMRFDA